MRCCRSIVAVLLAMLSVGALVIIPALAADDGNAPVTAGKPARGPLAGPRVKALFLGDNGHHKPLERFRQIASEMTRRGVDLTYVDEFSQITPENLKRFDALVLYANIDKSTPAVEQAILDYVANGGGYAVIHCGSFCFLNSTPLTQLAGGRFKRHGTGVFKETHVAPDHELLKDLKPIESWDETYVHEMHNEKDRQVLAVRADAEGKEPYTWTRTHGKGRVFYTAWGHDERTWGNRDFQDLLERGVRWAAGDKFLAPKSYHTPPQYTEGKAPNYLPGKQWGAQGDLITQIPRPISPEDSMQRMVLPAGVEAKLFAAEPKIFKPVAMAWDERGRIWIAETIDYPNELQERGKGNDRISILEDTNGDGVADSFTVFADKLSIPTSLCFANGGVIVAQAPDMLFLQDTDGDGKADVRNVLFTGWGTDDTHAGPSSLHYGPDNWVYGIVGYAGFSGTVGGERQRFSQGVWRIKPDGSKIEFLGSLTNNAWGLGFSEEGHLFASTANGDPSFYVSIPSRAYETVRGMNVKRLVPIMDSARIFSATEAVRQVDHHGNYTAAAGHELYTARTWPSYYWNRTAFVTEGTGHVVGQFLLIPQGSGFRARNDASMFASTDEWTAPVIALVGPDGQMWMVDWYNYIYQHNPVPRGFEKGKGNAYVTDLRDKTHGRIYRLVYGAGTPSKVHKLSKDDPAGLLAALRSDNMGWRLHAQRLLVERGKDDVAADLATLATDPQRDALGLSPAAMNALWTLHGLGLTDGKSPAAAAAVTGALKHASPGVRKAAVEVLPRTENGLALLLDGKLLDDADAQVRKSALLALAEMPQGSPAAGQAIHAALSRPEMATDTGLADAALIAAARHDAAFLSAALAAYKLPDGATNNTTADAPKNLLPNPSFEANANERPTTWRPRHYTGQGSQEYSASVGRTGTHSLILRSDRGADTSWFADVPCEPNTHYRLSAWIKTDNIKPVRNGMGALLNVHGTDFKTPALTGTADWRRVEIVFNSGSARTLSINCLYGGWGHATGVAYYDDIELVKTTGGVALPGASGRVLGAVITHYALRAPKESVVPTLASLKTAQPQIATTVVEALAAAWPEGKASAPQLGDAEVAELKAVLKALPEASRDRLVALAGKWGRADIFGEALAASVKEMTAIVADATAPAARRADAAKRLIAVADSADSVTAILKHVTPASPPDVQTALLAAAADSRDPAVGDQLAAAWPKLTPTAQKAALPILLRREPWTRALLAGIERGDINSKDLLPQDWQALTAHPNAEVAKLASSLQQKTGQTISADRKAIVDKLTPIVEKGGDIARGRGVYEKTCMVCHTLEGKGGKVGPDLTGVGARPKGDILIDVLDPNRSVEGTFRQWIAQTEDDVITGRLLSESQTSIEIIDAAGTVHPIQRSALKRLVASNMSVMPEGFEALPLQDLADLMAFLAESKVKH